MSGRRRTRERSTCVAWPVGSREASGPPWSRNSAAASRPWEPTSPKEARSSRHEFGHLLNIAIGSAAEVEYHTLLAHDLGFIDDDAYGVVRTQAIEVRRTLMRLRAKVIGNGSDPPPRVSLMTHNSRLTTCYAASIRSWMTAARAPLRTSSLSR